MHEKKRGGQGKRKGVKSHFAGKRGDSSQSDLIFLRYLAHTIDDYTIALGVQLGCGLIF